jgi:hypothetical protein
VKTTAPLIRWFTVPAFLLLVGTVAALAAPRDPATVGWFLRQIASARHLPAGTDADALRSLRGAGLAVPQLDPAKPLTEGDVVAIGSALGVGVTSKSPDAPFDQGHAQAFIASFATEIGAAPSPITPQDVGGNPNPSSDNGKGKKKGHNKSPSEPQ